MLGTASQLERLLQCDGSTRLVQVRRTSELAEKGRWRHRFLELVRHGREEALAEVPEEYRAVCEAIPIDELPTELGAEVALAIDLADGRAWEVGRGLDRDYGDLPVFSLAGTADVIGLGADLVYVGDWKSAGHRGRARDSLQLRLLALAAARAYGKGRVIVELIRLGDDGQVWRDRHEYDELDLDAFALELRARLSGPRTTELHTGSWCDYCPSRPVCPAQSLLALTVAEGRVFEDLSVMPPLTPARAGVAWDRLKAAKAMLSAIEKAIFATLDEAGGTLPLPGGRQLVRRKMPGHEKLDGEVVYGVMAELHGELVARKAIEMSTSKSAIREALRAVAGRGQLGKSEEAVLEQVRKLDGASRGTRLVTEEIEADPAKPATQPALGPARPPVALAVAGRAAEPTYVDLDADL